MDLASQMIGQCCQPYRQIFTHQLNRFWNLNADRREIPDAVNTGGDHSVSHYLGFSRRNSDNSNLNVSFTDRFFKLRYGQYFDTIDNLSDNCRILVK